VNGKRGLLVVISGPSGVGKDTLIQRLLELDPNLKKTVSYTTRRPRLGEKNGVDYLYMSPPELARKIMEGQVLEHATYDGNEYATSAAQVEEARAAGHDTILKIDVQGAEQVRHKVPDALLIFIAPPSLEELEQRQKKRHSESTQDMTERLKIAELEMAKRHEFDKVVVNEDLERAVRDVLEIVHEARSRHT
jgi:guanylate kinase